MNNLDKAKEVIAENVKNAQYGIFNTPNTMGDHMNVLYSNDEIKILICYYYEYFEGEHYINQAYIYEATEKFVEVCTRFRTENVKIGSSGLSIRMMREYDEKELDDKRLLFEKEYTANNDHLPAINIKQVSKEDFSVETAEPDLLAVIEKNGISVKKNAQALEEILSLYETGYDLKKGEIINRNGFYEDDDLAKRGTF